jgi:hypothetical protein
MSCQVLPPEDARSAAIHSVVESVVSDEILEPTWIAVTDDQDHWIHCVTACSTEARTRGVVAVTSEGALVHAVRLGIGGAMWLPPSASGAESALQAAAGAPVIPSPPGGWWADLVSESEQEMLAVTWVHRGFWRCQLGEPRMTMLLANLAAELEVIPALIPWPALVMKMRAQDEILSAWSRVVTTDNWLNEGLEIVRFSGERNPCGVASSALDSLVARTNETADVGTFGHPRPVYALPSGRLVGRWSPGEPADIDLDDEIWLAIPDSSIDQGYRWRLETASGIRWAEDVIEPTAASDVIRLPGWIATEIGPGRPAGLFAERIATQSDRLGVPLWVPNVDVDTLQFLLRLPGQLWVDGPAVPEAD